MTTVEHATQMVVSSVIAAVSLDPSSIFICQPLCRMESRLFTSGDPTALVISPPPHTSFFILGTENNLNLKIDIVELVNAKS